MTEITFDEIKVGDRIKTREVFDDGTVVEQEFTVTYKTHTRASNFYGVVFYDLVARTELTITRVAAPEPKKIGTVVEYMCGKGLVTAVRFTLDTDAEYGWIRPSGYTLTWDEILESDPNPKIKED